MNIVIVTHNRTDLLRKTLASIASAEKPACYERTIVVENGSQAGAADVVAEFADDLNAVYEFVADRRKTVSLNHALDLIDDGLVVFFDDDIRIEPQTLTAYALAAEEGPDWYYGGPAVPDYVVPPPDWLQRYLPASAGGLELPVDVGPVAHPQTMLGFNWAVHRETLERFGRFREDLGPGTITGAGDEAFLQLAMNQGDVFGRYVPTARVWHFVPPERCSPEWTLRRSYSGGFNAGRVDQRKAHQSRQWFGFARAFAARLWKQMSRSNLLRAASLSVAGRFWLRYVTHWMTSFTRGWHHARTVDRMRDEQPQAAAGTAHAQTTLGGYRS